MSQLEKLTVTKVNNEKVVIYLTALPDECPYCFNKIYPKVIWGYSYNDTVHVLLACTHINCNKCFVANYHGAGNNQYTFQTIAKANYKSVEFNSVINDISPSFVKIYKESNVAEQQGLTEICGVGYRKSLEFLIKDYIIRNNPDIETEVKKTFLGNCINKYIDNTNIQTTASRAAWLGNDESHYVKTWVDKDLNDLKKLIDITVLWIEMEELTKQFMNEMPKEKTEKTNTTTSVSESNQITE